MPVEKINHLKHNMYVSGMGVVLLGFWSIIKTIISITLGAQLYTEEQLSEIPEDEITIVYVLAYIFIIIVLLLIFLFHSHIGLNAMRRAKGKKFKKAYFFWSIFFLIFLLLGMPSYFIQLEDLWDIDSVIAAILVDLTLSFLLIDIIYSSIKIKKFELKKEV